MEGHVADGSCLGGHHVCVEVRWPPNGLTRIVDDEVEALARGEHLAAERLDARRVSKVQTEDLQPFSPLLEIGLLRVPLRRITRKPRRHDQTRASSKQLQAGLIADLHAPAGQEGRAPAEVRQLGSFAKVEGGALRTQLIVEVVYQRILLLAHITMLEFFRAMVRGCKVRGCEVRRMRGRDGATVRDVVPGLDGAVSGSSLESSNGTESARNTFGVWKTGFRRNVWIPVAARATLIALDACGPSLTRHDLGHAPPFNAVGMVYARHGLQQSPAIILGHSLEHTPVGGDRFEQLDGISKTRRERLRWGFGCGHQLRVTQSESLAARATLRLRRPAARRNSCSVTVSVAREPAVDQSSDGSSLSGRAEPWRGIEIPRAAGCRMPSEESKKKGRTFRPAQKLRRTSPEA